VGKFE